MLLQPVLERCQSVVISYVHDSRFDLSIFNINNFLFVAKKVLSYPCFYPRTSISGQLWHTTAVFQPEQITKALRGNRPSISFTEVRCKCCTPLVQGKLTGTDGVAAARWSIRSSCISLLVDVRDSVIKPHSAPCTALCYLSLHRCTVKMQRPSNCSKKGTHLRHRMSDIRHCMSTKKPMTAGCPEGVWICSAVYYVMGAHGPLWNKHPISFQSLPHSLFNWNTNTTIALVREPVQLYCLFLAAVTFVTGNRRANQLSK